LSFNPRLPGGRRQALWRGIRASAEFQSTPSGGKATSLAAHAARGVAVSIHAFRGEGDPAPRCRHARRTVSIHAFRGEGDFAPAHDPARLPVSIHAFRGEGDVVPPFR